MVDKQSIKVDIQRLAIIRFPAQRLGRRIVYRQHIEYNIPKESHTAQSEGLISPADVNTPFVLEKYWPDVLQCWTFQQSEINPFL